MITLKWSCRIELSNAPKFRAYHSPAPVKRNRSVDLDSKQFVVWDGEGVNLHGTGRPQSYILFGSSEGYVVDLNGLSTYDCLEHILETGEANPQAVHAGFAFSYDVNMICQSLSPTSLARLHRDGKVRLKRKDDTYMLTFLKGKYFRVTRYRPEYDRKKNPHAKTTVTIFDVFSFFMSSFVKAYEDLIGPVPEVVKEGKKGRSSFTINEYDTILKYWELEIQLLKELCEELRRRVYNAGLRINQWHGPGALADFAMKQHNIKQHMAETSPEIREAARYAYAGGRFELYKMGHVSGPLFGIDINSAYPYAISLLPSLADGYWRHVSNPRRLVRFGVYRVVFDQSQGFEHTPSPLFHRDRNHNITFPWRTRGWYWAPEVRMAAKKGARVVEGWEFVHGDEKPFAWVHDTYATRRDWKARGISAQLALKLLLNAMYGKLAQRVGYDPETGKVPAWHQLEWAGWVTSYVRAMLYEVIDRIPWDNLIAVETDGIYTTKKPEELGIANSKELGGWEVSQYSELFYVQSGLAWLKHTSNCGCGKCADDGWESKRRGLDGCRSGHLPTQCDCEGVFSLAACRDYLASLQPMEPWQPYVGRTTRFVGMGSALASSVETQLRHCVWETRPRDILPGSTGKRIHIHRACRACALGQSADQEAHDLVIRSMSLIEPESVPHAIPWETTIGDPLWRQYEDIDNEIHLGMI